MLSTPVNRRSVKLYPLSLVAIAAAAAANDDDDGRGALISIVSFAGMDCYKW